MKADRRDFLKYFLGSGAALTSLTGRSHPYLNQEETVSLTILHTNDTHSHIDPFPADHPRYPGKGGVRKRKTIIDQIRAEEENLLLLDAGDIFQGTPYFNVYKGELEFKVMSKIKYDAATMGNHDFDIGLDGFLNAYPLANFPFVCSNYDFSDTPLQSKTSPFQIIRKGPLKIGIIGLGVELEGLVSKKLYGNTIYNDPIKVAQETADLLKNELKCNMVIVLSHLGYSYKSKKVSDKILALETSKIDLIIGGHTHTFLEAPELHKNKEGKPVLINQVGWAGINIGRIDFSLFKNDNGDISYHPIVKKNEIISV